LPIDEASATINTTGFSFTRAFALAGRYANVGVVLPVVAGHIEGRYLGEPAEVDRFGQADMRVRMAVNLYGAPAMTPKEFASYQQGGIVGVSVTVVPPVGQYDSAKLINIGNHRWSYKTEVGLSRTFGKWVVEGMGGIWFFTDNDEFYGGRTREQDPIRSVQFHATYRFSRTMWLGGNANFYRGGRTTINGKANLDLQSNSRVGMTFSKALKPKHAIRASISRGAFTTIGAEFTSLGFSYSYAWLR
ncbi:MAG TPA: transporter, partial [Vicinamibacterales bacterium]